MATEELINSGLSFSLRAQKNKNELTSQIGKYMSLYKRESQKKEEGCVFVSFMLKEGSLVLFHSCFAS